MTYPSVFEEKVVQQLKARIDKLSPETKPQWGVMNASQMLAHLSVAYDVIFSDRKPRYNFFMKLMMKWVIKGIVVGDKPYKKNSRTAPNFLIADEREFETEKSKLLDHLNKVQQQGSSHYDGKENPSFGPLTVNEWNNLFYKHLDHHLRQFGV